MSRNWTQAEVEAHQRRVLGPVFAGPRDAGAATPGAPSTERTVRASKTEWAYYYSVLAPRLQAGEFSKVTHQWPARWPLKNGHHYSPDWVCWRGATIVECHEVKGGFARKTGLQRDSRVLFDSARTDYPEIAWVWWERR